MTRTMRPLTLFAALLTAGALLTACGGQSSTAGSGGQDAGIGAPRSSSPSTSGTPAAGAHNDADVAFAASMILHHAQAVEMAELAATSAEDPAVKELAATIRAAQAPEIAKMKGWLAGWGESVPDPSVGSMNHDKRSMGGGMAGMMNDQEMSDLAKESGRAFERLFLALMIRHHEGAVTMARQELADGSNSDAKQLAQAVIDAQTSEIATMRELLAG